jgi:hypothetical protein
MSTIFYCLKLLPSKRIGTWVLVMWGGKFSALFKKRKIFRTGKFSMENFPPHIIRLVSINVNMNVNFLSQFTFVFSTLHKNGVLKSCPNSQPLWAYKISWPHVEWCKFCVYLFNLNVRHFCMVEATTLCSMVTRSPSMAWSSYWISRKSTNWFKS